MVRVIRTTLVLLVLAVGSAAKDPLDRNAVMAEPNLEKRAGKALDFASRCIDEARRFYREGRLKDALTRVEETAEAAELAHKSLIDTGKNPSKSPKHFKRAELKTRELARRLDSLGNDMSYDEREPVDKARLRVQEVNEALLTGIMTGKKK